MLVKCPQCKGKGEYNYFSDTTQTEYPVKCQDCNGTGKVARSYINHMAAYQRKRKQEQVKGL